VPGDSHEWEQNHSMSSTEIIANVLCVAGAALWVFGYFVTGHPAVLDWPSFAPSWISAFLPNFESELGMLVSLAGVVFALPMIRR